MYGALFYPIGANTEESRFARGFVKKPKRDWIDDATDVPQ
jgi:hypothetical protein